MGHLAHWHSYIIPTQSYGYLSISLPTYRVDIDVRPVSFLRTALFSSPRPDLDKYAALQSRWWNHPDSTKYQQMAALDHKHLRLSFWVSRNLKYYMGYTKGTGANIQISHTQLFRITDSFICFLALPQPHLWNAPSSLHLCQHVKEFVVGLHFFLKISVFKHVSLNS